MNDYSFEDTRAVNVDITFRCPLQCYHCGRQTKEWSSSKKDMSIETFDKLINHFDTINFCGQQSDPIHHPKFIEFLGRAYNKNVRVNVHTASSFKKEEWFLKAFNAHKDAVWTFGIDGLPQDSHNYRVNQDGEKLYNMMLKARDILNKPPVWQYIIFRYNEDDIERAKEMAISERVQLLLFKSARWIDNDQLQPSNPDNFIPAVNI